MIHAASHSEEEAFSYSSRIVITDASSQKKSEQHTTFDGRKDQFEKKDDKLPQETSINQTKRKNCDSCQVLFERVMVTFAEPQGTLWTLLCFFFVCNLTSTYGPERKNRETSVSAFCELKETFLQSASACVCVRVWVRVCACDEKSPTC